MRITRGLFVGALCASAALGLSSCAPTTPAIEPVTAEVGELQGETIELEVGQMLDIDTGDLAPPSYNGEVADGEVAEFVRGQQDHYSPTTNPGVRALAVGSTEVVLSNEDGGIQNVTFTVEVTE